MSCTTPNAYRLNLTCNDDDMEDVLIGDLLDDNGDVCATFCALIDAGDGYKVKASFSGGYYCASSMLNVCHDANGYFICLPGTTLKSECCTGCIACCDKIESEMAAGTGGEVRITWPDPADAMSGGTDCDGKTTGKLPLTYVDGTHETPDNYCVLRWASGSSSLNITFCVDCDSDDDSINDDTGMQISASILLDDINETPATSTCYIVGHWICPDHNCHISGDETDQYGVRIEWNINGL